MYRPGFFQKVSQYLKTLNASWLHQCLIHILRRLTGPACGTGGISETATLVVLDFNPLACSLHFFCQDPETAVLYAVGATGLLAVPPPPSPPGPCQHQAVCDICKVCTRQAKLPWSSCLPETHISMILIIKSPTSKIPILLPWRHILRTRGQRCTPQGAGPFYWNSPLFLGWMTSLPEIFLFHDSRRAVTIGVGLYYFVLEGPIYLPL